MRHVDWNKEYPEVPKSVHNSVLDALSRLDEQKQEEKTMKKTQKRKILLIAATLTVLIGTTAAASEIFQWNERAGQVFEADEATQNELTMDQMAQDVSQSVTDQGITITAIQTIQDKNRFYALFEVKAEDTEQRITADYSMDYTMDLGGKESPFCALGWGFVPQDVQEVSNIRYFEIYGTKNEQSEENLTMNLNFTALRGEPAQKAGEGEILTSGQWNFALDIRTSKMLSYTIDTEYELSGESVHIASIALSPLSMEIVYDGSDIRTLEAKQNVSLDQLDELSGIYPTGVRYEDGTVIEEELMIPLSEGFEDKEETTYRLLLPFHKLITPEKVTEILIGESAVKLK